MKPLQCAAAMRMLAIEIGDDRRLSVGPRHGGDARRLAHPRAKAVGADDEAGRKRAAISAAQHAPVGVERKRVEREGGVDGNTGRAHEGDERGAQRALLDDPGKRALSQVIGREIEPRAGIALDAHRLDRRKAIDRNILPRAQGAKKRGAAGTDRVDARVPGLAGRRRFRRRHWGAIGERDGKPARDERGREREPHQAGAGDDDIVVHSRCGHWRTATPGAGAAALMAPVPGSRSRGAGWCRCKGRPRW